MRHAWYLTAAFALASCGTCGSCEEHTDDGAAEGEAEATVDERETAGSTALPSRTGEASPRCVAFCRRSLECAEAEGRPVPASARDCNESCSPGGTHASAPETAWDCADAPCGPAFQACSMQAMMEHMRGSSVAVFPVTCPGFCNKVAYCAERTAREPDALSRDCDRACAPGGGYATLPPEAYSCVQQACGQPFDTCVEAARGGPASP